MTQIVFVIIFVNAIPAIMAIPRREVQPDVDAAGLSGVNELPNDVAAAIFPGTFDNGVGGVIRRPETKPVVVFRGEDDVGNAGLDGGFDPLVGVERGGVEDGRIFVAGAPFTVSEGVDAEVEEHDELPLLPFELREGWQREDWQWRRYC